MKKIINVFQPQLGNDELKSIKRVFKSNWLGKGKITDEFEMEFSSYLSVKNELIKSTTCCTEGLFQSMRLLNIGQGDEVILPTISFIGAINAIVDSGATPIFCDVDAHTLNATAETISEKVTSKTKAVIIIHYGGYPCSMDDIIDLTDKYDIYLIEDSACSIASKYKGQNCGTFGDIGVWSFDAMKILVTGDGGMIYIKNPELSVQIEKMLYLGLKSESGLTKANSIDKKWWEFDIECAGRRAIMNDITSSIGLVQLKKLPGFIKRRQEIHNLFLEGLGNIDWLILPPELSKDCKSSYYFFWIQVKNNARDQLALYLKSNKIYTTFRYFPLHKVKYFQSDVLLKNAEMASNNTLCLPMHQSLSNSDVNKIIETIKNFNAIIK